MGMRPLTSPPPTLFSFIFWLFFFFIQIFVMMLIFISEKLKALQHSVPLEGWTVIIIIIQPPPSIMGPIVVTTSRAGSAVTVSRAGRGPSGLRHSGAESDWIQTWWLSETTSLEYCWWQMPNGTCPDDKHFYQVLYQLGWAYTRYTT